MSSNDFLPRRDAELRQWSRAFSETLSSDPEAVGVTLQQAADYAALDAAYAHAFYRATQPSTRTSPAIAEKNTVRKKLRAAARKLSRQIHGHPGVTATQLNNLGLSLRAPGGGDVPAIPAPDSPPRVTVVDMRGRTATIRLREDVNSHSSARPRGVAGAFLYAFIGDTPPARLADWTFLGGTPRTSQTITFDANLEPGQKVWITATWVNPTFEQGPVATAAHTHINHGHYANPPRSLGGSNLFTLAAAQAA